MCRSLLLSILLFALCSVSAQQQEAIVKTRGRQLHDGSIVKGRTIAEVFVTVADGSTYESGEDGRFAFYVNGEFYQLKKVYKEDYVLADADFLTYRRTYSSEPLQIVLAKPSELLHDMLYAEQQMRTTIAHQFACVEREIEDLYYRKEIAEQEYYQRLQQLYDEKQSSDSYVRKMSETFAKIDFDDINDFNGELYHYILSGDLVRADSMLVNTCIDEELAAIAKHRAANTTVSRALAESEQFTQRRVTDIASRCYSKHLIHSLRFERDSAAYYLGLRADLDATNMLWQMDAAIYYRDYMADYDRSFAILDSALKYNVAHVGEDDMVSATLYNEIALCFYDKGEYRKAEEYHLQALNIRKRLELSNHVALSNNNLGNVYLQLGDYDKALEYSFAALSALVNIEANEVYNPAITLNNIALIYSRKSEYDKALDYQFKALAVQQNTERQDESFVALLHCNLGVIYYKIKDYNQALECYFKAWEIYEKIYGVKHPSTARLCNNIATCYDALQRDTEALQYLHRAVCVYERYYGVEHPETATIYSNIGSCYSDLGANDSAMDYYNRALAIRQKVLDKGHSIIAITHNNIAFLLYKKGDCRMAVEQYLQAIEIWEVTLGATHPNTTMAYYNIAKCYEQLGDRQSELQYLLKLLNVRKEVLGDRHPDTAKAYNNVALTYNELGNRQLALQYMRKVHTIFSKCLPKEHPNVVVTRENIKLIKGN